MGPIGDAGIGPWNVDGTGAVAIPMSCNGRVCSFDNDAAVQWNSAC